MDGFSWQGDLSSYSCVTQCWKVIDARLLRLRYHHRWQHILICLTNGEKASVGGEDELQAHERVIFSSEALQTHRDNNHRQEHSSDHNSLGLPWEVACNRPEVFCRKLATG